ncbi:MAG TPA: ABC transporter ATP-binding protein [Clostridia bacterium]|nr:ABC transporter ATP-binding protein [Clostridia bacterium]HPK15040.1 ABC transporter ATP-binding protein [Clostridia bacterium]
MKPSYPVAKTLRRLLANAASNDRGVFFLFALYTIGAALLPFPPVVLPKLVIGELTGAARPEYLFYIVGGFFLVSAALVFMKDVADQNSYMRIARLRIDFVRDQFTKLIRIDYPHAEDDKFLDRYEKAFSSTRSNNNGVEAVYRSLFKAPAPALTVLALAVFIGMKNPLILAAIFVNIAAVVFIGRKVHAFRFGKREQLGHAERRKDYFLRTTHDFTYGKDIRVYNLRERVIENCRREIRGYVDILSVIAKREYLWGFLGLATLLLSDAATYGLLAADVARGMSIADFSMYLAAAASLSLYLKNLSAEITTVLNEGEYVHELFRFLDEDLYGPRGTRGPVEGDTLEIEFRDVSFKYPRGEKHIFEHLNLTIRKGERLALVGVNGAGKSTLVKLMTGLFHPTEGEIFINGVPIGEFEKKALYSMFSAVFQEVNVLAYTVLENVSACDGGDRARAEEALKKAGLWEKVCSLPKGLDTVLLKVIDEQGAILSGGEAQKLAIARALYKDANMVVMDEPTAALDALAEQDIYERFGELTKGKTALYISHRLASTRFCDRIILLDGARVAEEGTHAELMASRGKYCEMFTVQGKYYTQGAAGKGAKA